MNDLVGLALPGGPVFVDELRRAWDRGDAVAPVDLRLPPAARDDAIAAIRPTVLVDEDGRRAVPHGEPVEPGDALVMTTSGTSGAPKGVVLTHDAVAAAARATTTALAVDPACDRWLACLPLAHVGGLSVVTRALMSDTPLEIHPGFDAAAVTDAARRGATLVSLVPAVLARIDPAMFRRILLGGSALPSDRPANSVATYGLTETGGGLVYDGRPLEGVEVRVVGGEIQLRGPMLLRCYRDHRDPFTPDGWFPTGDGGRFEGGVLSVDGRIGDVIVTGGEKVWPTPVEQRLRSHAHVRDVAVVGRPDPYWGEIVTAVVVPGDAASPPALGRPARPREVRAAGLVRTARARAGRRAAAHDARQSAARRDLVGRHAETGSGRYHDRAVDHRERRRHIVGEQRGSTEAVGQIDAGGRGHVYRVGHTDRAVDHRRDDRRGPHLRRETDRTEREVGPAQRLRLHDHHIDRAGAERPGDVVDRAGRLVDRDRDRAAGTDRADGVDSLRRLLTPHHVVGRELVERLDGGVDTPPTVGIEPQAGGPERTSRRGNPVAVDLGRRHADLQLHRRVARGQRRRTLGLDAVGSGRGGERVDGDRGRGGRRQGGCERDPLLSGPEVGEGARHRSARGRNVLELVDDRFQPRVVDGVDHPHCSHDCGQRVGGREEVVGRPSRHRCRFTPPGVDTVTEGEQYTLAGVHRTPSGPQRPVQREAERPEPCVEPGQRMPSRIASPTRSGRSRCAA